ncbi:MULTISPECIES: hypothetical protein [unclassified Anabaena]|uniref:hypothetical protein n=1 Tax=unclassified Anabaena TaxID=2619674 RepID=UPI0039C70090
MNFSFSNKKPQVNPQLIAPIKQWIYQIFPIDPDTPISLSQLNCTEANCPPIETVISLMTMPPQQYKIHKAIADIDYEDITQLLSDK